MHKGRLWSYVDEIELSCTDAERYCRRMGGHLAALESIQEQVDARDLSGGGRYFGWSRIGLSYDERTQAYIWLDGSGSCYRSAPLHETRVCLALNGSPAQPRAARARLGAAWRCTRAGCANAPTARRPHPD